MAGQIKITLRRSTASANAKQRAVLQGLGLRRMNQSVVRKDNPAIRGMVFKVQHMVQVEDGA